MFGLFGEYKAIVIVSLLVLCVVACIGALIYHEATTATLRADAKKARAALTVSQGRIKELDTALAMANVQIEAANANAALAQEQAAKMGELQNELAIERAKNRRAINEYRQPHSSQACQSVSVAPVALSCEIDPALASAAVLARFNDLFCGATGELCDVPEVPDCGGSR